MGIRLNQTKRGLQPESLITPQQALAQSILGNVGAASSCDPHGNARPKQHLEQSSGNQFEEWGAPEPLREPPHGAWEKPMEQNTEVEQFEAAKPSVCLQNIWSAPSRRRDGKPEPTVNMEAATQAIWAGPDFETPSPSQPWGSPVAQPAAFDEMPAKDDNVTSDWGKQIDEFVEPKILRTERGTIEFINHPNGTFIHPTYNLCGILTSVEFSDGSKILRQGGASVWTVLDPWGAPAEIEVTAVTIDRKGTVRYTTAEGDQYLIFSDGSVSLKAVA